MQTLEQIMIQEDAKALARIRAEIAAEDAFAATPEGQKATAAKAARADARADAAFQQGVPHEQFDEDDEDDEDDE